MEGLLVSYLRSLVIRAFHRQHRSVGSIPARGPIVDDDFFSNVLGLNFDMCMISTRTKTQNPFEIIQH